MASNDFFERLRGPADDVWTTYVTHPFVTGLADGSLPPAAFRHYLGQDYLFLMHFARAHALAVYKSETLEDMRAGAAGIAAILDTEIDLHVSYCAGWGLSQADMAALPEDPACVAYTRFVLDCGNAGDLLDLQVALAPCVVGYGEIGRRLAADPATKTDGNPYADWIAMYAGAEYQAVVTAARAHLDDLAVRRGGAARFDALADTFRAATRLEVGFWQMGLDHS